VAVGTGGHDHRHHRVGAQHPTRRQVNRPGFDEKLRSSGRRVDESRIRRSSERRVRTHVVQVSDASRRVRYHASENAPNVAGGRRRRWSRTAWNLAPARATTKAPKPPGDVVPIVQTDDEMVSWDRAHDRLEHERSDDIATRDAGASGQHLYSPFGIDVASPAPTSVASFGRGRPVRPAACVGVVSLPTPPRRATLVARPNTGPD